MSEEGEIKHSPTREFFVKTPSHFLSVVHKLYRRESCIAFWNCSREFKILIQRDDDADSMDEYMTFDVCIAIDSDGDSDSDSDVVTCAKTVRKVIDLDYDGWYNGEAREEYVLFTIMIPHDATVEQTDLIDAIKKINTLWLTKICGCREHFKHPDDDTCAACELMATEDMMIKEMCIICHEHGPRMHMIMAACCKQPMHTTCLETWRTTKLRREEIVTCPMCRSLI